MKTMKTIFLIPILLLSSKVLFAQSISEIIAISPIEAAEKAYTSGNTKLIIVPGCSDEVPGYGGGQPLNPPQRLWKSCEELFGKEQYKKIKELKAWTKKYNQHIMGKYK